MKLPPNLKRRLLWRRRVQAGRAWQDAERRAAAQRSEAIRRILDLAVESKGRPERSVR